jgi:hypothetical protein
MKRFAKIIGRIAFVIFLFTTTFAVTFGLYVFCSPEFHVTTELAAKLVSKYAPHSLKIGFDQFTLEINRPKDRFWSKTIVFKTKNLCVQYSAPAVDTCIEDIRISFTAGFDGPVLANQSKLIPHISHIDPLLINNAIIHLDLTAFPKSQNSKPSNFNALDFLRKEIIPKWDLEGSRVNVTDFRIKTEAVTEYSAKFDLQPGEGDQDVKAILHEVQQINGPLRAHASVVITRPRDWGADKVNTFANGKQEQVSANRWKFVLDGDVNLDAKREILLKADSNILDLQQLNFRLQAFFKGIPAVQEARFEGDVHEDAFKGTISLKAGSQKAELQVLDFVNCAVNANLQKKEGGVHCGPQSVRLQIRERGLLHRPDLFVFQPEIDLKITNVNFGDKKSADVSLDILMDHLGMLRLGTKLAGHVEIAKQTTYNLKGRADIVVPQFQQISQLLKVTPYAIPAPLNTLDGAVGVQANIDFSDQGGHIEYQAATRLDSDYQSVHLDLNGKTKLDRINGSLEPNTEIDLAIVQLMLSAPRFELRAPPAFKPDPRFGPINQKLVREKLTATKESSPSRFKIHVHTTTPAAIHIATNLTKAAIPLTVDATFDDHTGEKSPVTGFVEVGQTPIELFKRSATVQNIRVDLLGSGDNRLNGIVGISYGDYAITILLLGQVSDPQVRFISDPPLDDNQIVSVLLFGRPPYELGSDEKNSVANTKAAMADAVLGLGSLYFLASTPIESVGYDPDSGRVIARVGLGGGASIELGAGANSGSGVGFRKRLSKDFTFRSDVETLGSTGRQTVSALIEWVKRF